ncbi:hypothetical protein ACFQ1S_34995, partial [Kibdelosporangium lantanae]
STAPPPRSPPTRGGPHPPTVFLCLNGYVLATAAQGMRANGATRGVVWVPENDDVSVAFYERAGWERDGTVRTLDTGGRALREIRLTGDLDLRLT